MDKTSDQASRFVKDILLLAVFFGVAAVAASWIFASLRIAASVAAGSAISLASFGVLAFVIIRSTKGGSGVLWVAALGIIKMALIGIILWWLITKGLVEPIGFLAGFTTMVVALVVEGLRIKH